MMTNNMDSEMQNRMNRLLSILAALILSMTTWADVLGVYSFEGTLGDKIPVRLKFAVNGDEIAVGEIYYPKAKNPAPIRVKRAGGSGARISRLRGPSEHRTRVCLFRLESRLRIDDGRLCNVSWSRQAQAALRGEQCPWQHC